MAATGGAILEARALGLRFGAVEALKDVSVAIRPGDVHALIGPNGAGKSSLLNCLSGFYHPWTGAVMFEGRDISATRPPERARMGIGRTFQGIQTYPSMTARENILTRAGALSGEGARGRCPARATSCPDRAFWQATTVPGKHPGRARRMVG